MQLGIFTLLVVGTVVPAGIATGVRGLARPPSSLEPVAPSSARRSVSVSHRSQRVQKCDASKATGRLRCIPELEDTDSATTVTFHRVGPPDSTSGDAEVSLTFPKHVGLQELNTELAPGQWDVDWPGAGALKHAHVDAQSDLSVALRTTAGVCVVRDDQCRLVESVVRRRVTVTDRGH